MGILRKLFGPKATVIESPALGVLDLTSGGSDSHLESDSKSFFHHFLSIDRSTSLPPKCDFLLIYAKFADSGAIEGAALSLREIIRDSEATVVVVATENGPDAYIAAAANVGYGQANLVMTIERNDSAFGLFFDKLLTAMLSGETMPIAWNRLAPQIPGLEHEQVPGTIFACERGQIAFAHA